MEAITLVGINTYATNATMVSTINDVEEAGFKVQSHDGWSTRP